MPSVESTKIDILKHVSPFVCWVLFFINFIVARFDLKLVILQIPTYLSFS